MTTMSTRFIRSSLRQRGVTLTELMIALVLALLVALAATSMVVTSRTTYRTQDEATRLAESARFGLELMNRMVRLAGYTNFGNDTGIPGFYAVDPLWISDSYALNGPDIVGANNSKPGGGASVNGSDSLTIRYFGANKPGDIDFGTILDCAGFAVPEPVGAAAGGLAATNRAYRAYNVLFVDSDTDGEPALKCQRQTYDNAGVASGLPGQTQTLIRGVESFQVLYGEALYAPLADPDSVPPINIAYRTGLTGPNPVSNWNNVVSVRVALLLRSATGARPDPDSTTYNLFGANYPAGDTGTQIVTSGMSTSDRTRARRIVETTVFVRNRLSNWPSLDVE